MGANTFCSRSKGKNAKEAFNEAVRQAQYDHGHSGYTGTIAEKREFVMIDLPKGANPGEEADRLINASDPRVDDKWGPAGCFHLGGEDYMFFGWASS